MSCVAIIPARGGSKSIPRKNVRYLAGKPLIAHTIIAAQASAQINRVIVSTDDAEIKQVALEHGAEVIDRPAELATDTASSESALLHAIATMEQTEGKAPELVVFLQCTSPFTRPADIDGLLELMRKEHADSAFSSAPFHGFVWKEGAGDLVGVNHDKSERLRRQDRHPEFLEDGAIYAFMVAGFQVARHRFFGKTVTYQVEPALAFEIDEPADFDRAAAHLEGARPQAYALPTRIGAIAFDFDGVFTDDRVMVSEKGEEAVMCSRRDGMGVAQLHDVGVPMVVISKERVPIVEQRCRKLKLEVMSGVDNKLAHLQRWLKQRSIDPLETVFIGNDVNDLECMEFVGCAVAPCDAHSSALESADIVLSSCGGRGAVRELADLVCETLAAAGRP